MSTTISLASLAAGLAAGSYTNEFVLNSLGGDKSLFDRVLGMASAGVVTGVASSLIGSLLESNDITSDLGEDMDDFISDIFDF